MRVLVASGLVLGTALGAPRVADACIPVFERAIVERPHDAVATGTEAVDVDCHGDATCSVRWSFGTGDSRRVVETVVALPLYRDDCFTDGVIARHPVLAPAPRGHQRVLQIDTTATPRVTKPASWSLEVDARAATKYDPATTRLWFDVPGRLVTHGGPVLLVGAASDEGRVLRLRGGWEVAIARPWLVVGLTADTDVADHWNVALAAEPTSRAWLLPLSFGAGGGVVLANGERVGGRGQLSIALGPARVVLSLDVVQDDDGEGADLGLVGLVGGSL